MSEPNEDLVWIGPYTAGEIPLPLDVFFADSNDAPIIFPGVALARWVMRRHAQSAGVPFGAADPAAVIKNAVVAAQGVSPGKTTYGWVAGDLDTAGDYEAEMWVGNNSGFRLASRRFVFHVRAAITLPPGI